MRLVVSVTAIAPIHVLALAGCLSDPTFEQANDGTSTSSSPTISADGEMVLVPATTITTSRPPPSPPGPPPPKSDNSGKGKGGEDDDKGRPNERVVPAFWMDLAPVATRDYEACTTASACTPSSCPPLGSNVVCITHAQAAAYCGWKQKRLVRDDEWTAAALATPAGLIGLSGSQAEWVADTREAQGIARGGATSGASVTLGLDSSMPSVGFRCARDR